MEKQIRPEHELLIEAGILLASSLDYKVTLANVAHLLTHTMADWCAIDLMDESGTIQRVAVAHIDPNKQALAEELQRRYPVLQPQATHTITQRVLYRGETWLDSDVSPVRLEAEARDHNHYLLLKELGFTSEIVVPLTARGHVLGTLTLVLGEGTRRYDDADKSLVEELARRIALAVDNARLFGEVQAQREWFQVILSSIGDGVIATNADGRVMFMNPIASALTGWHFEEAQGREVETVFHIINEHTRAPVQTPLRQALAQGVKVGLANHTVLIARDGSERPISDSGAPIWDREGRMIGAVLVFRDVSEQRAAEKALKASEARYRNLIENANDIIYTLDLAGNLTSLNKAGERVLGYEAREMLNQAIAGIFEPADLDMMQDKLRRKLEGEARTQYEVNARTKDGRRVTLEVNSQLIKVEGVPTGIYGIARDISERKRSDERINLLLELSQAFSQANTAQQVGEVMDRFNLSFPLDKPKNPDEEAFFTTLTNLCAQSIERARLYEEENQARRLAESLQATGNALNSALELSDVFDQILNNIDRIVPHDLADIMLVDKGIGRIVRSRGYTKTGLAQDEHEMEKITVNIAETYYFRWAAEHQQPRVVTDAKTDPNWVQLQDPDLIRSNIIAPILIDGRIAGFLNVNSLVPNFYTEKDADILQTFANQAAIAIKHAQLHQQAVETAAAKERQRIARDLHDAVSQTLFAASLIAESLHRLWERRPEQAREQTQTLHHLTKTAAAEMRVLLYELRPESLVNTNLRELLTQLAHATLGRKHFGLSLLMRGTHEQLLPPDVQITFYRIAQEALNNILKHGHAKQVRLRLDRTERAVTMVILDNGQGFDTTHPSGGIGLQSMWERASSIGASLDVKSRVGCGTRVRLVWHKDARRR